VLLGATLEKKAKQKTESSTALSLGNATSGNLQQEGQHLLTRQRAANFRLLNNQ